MKHFKNKKQVFFVLCCHNRTHYTLSILDTPRKRLIVIDSFNQKGLHNKLLNFLNSSKHWDFSFKLNEIDVVEQQENWTCGYGMVYLI